VFIEVSGFCIFITEVRNRQWRIVGRVNSTCVSVSIRVCVSVARSTRRGSVWSLEPAQVSCVSRLTARNAELSWPLNTYVDAANTVCMAAVFFKIIIFFNFLANTSIKQIAIQQSITQSNMLQDRESRMCSCLSPKHNRNYCKNQIDRQYTHKKQKILQSTFITRNFSKSTFSIRCSSRHHIQMT